MAVMLVSPVLRTTTLRPKQESLWQWTISSPVDLVFAANHAKSNFRVFSTAVNISINMHNFIDFRDQRDSHNYSGRKLSS